MDNWELIIYIFLHNKLYNTFLFSNKNWKILSLPKLQKTLKLNSLLGKHALERAG